MHDNDFPSVDTPQQSKIRADDQAQRHQLGGEGTGVESSSSLPRRNNGINRSIGSSGGSTPLTVEDGRIVACFTDAGGNNTQQQVLPSSEDHNKEQTLRHRSGELVAVGPQGHRSSWDKIRKGFNLTNLDINKSPINKSPSSLSLLPPPPTRTGSHEGSSSGGPTINNSGATTPTKVHLSTNYHLLSNIPSSSCIPS